MSMLLQRRRYRYARIETNACCKLLCDRFHDSNMRWKPSSVVIDNMMGTWRERLGRDHAGGGLHRKRSHSLAEPHYSGGHGNT